MTSASSTKRSVTVTAPVNIAVVKYWGKRDTKLMLPTNSSLSLTLSQKRLCTTTSVTLEENTQDTLVLNQQSQPMSQQKRFNAVLEAVRLARRQLEQSDASLPVLSELGVTVVSENNFPTAAGLASSAAGFAALAYAFAAVFELPWNLSQVSSLARLGSGSACRSLFGGFVAWDRGTAADGHDSVARPVASVSHWPEMETLVLVVSAAKKHVASTAGMQQTVETSELFAHRIQNTVPERMKQMEQAIQRRDFDSFAALTMKDSNQFHSVCLDTFPPIQYLTDTSHAIIRLLHLYNQLTATEQHQYRAAYTFDAGPNAVIYTQKQYVAELVALVDHFLPPSAQVDSSFYYGHLVEDVSVAQTKQSAAFRALVSKMEALFEPMNAGALTRLIHAELGPGPQLVSVENVDVKLREE